MVLAVSIVVVRLARRVCCVIWTMRAHLIRVMRTQYVIQVQLMDRLHVHVLPATKESIVQKILMNVIKVSAID
jgi:hypothetical protein